MRPESHQHSNKLRSHTKPIQGCKTPPTSSGLRSRRQLNCNPCYGSFPGSSVNTEADTFQIKMEFKDRKKTKRGFLGYIMSPFDPIGAGAPAMLSTKLLQREIFPPKTEDPMHLQEIGWDDEIPLSFISNRMPCYKQFGKCQQFHSIAPSTNPIPECPKANVYMPLQTHRI